MRKPLFIGIAIAVLSGAGLLAVDYCSGLTWWSTGSSSDTCSTFAPPNTAVTASKNWTIKNMFLLPPVRDIEVRGVQTTGSGQCGMMEVNPPAPSCPPIFDDVQYTYLDGNTKHRWEQQVQNRVWVPFPLYGFCYTLTTSTYTEQFSPQACPDPEPDPCAGGCPEPQYMCGEGEEVVLDECGCASCYSPIFVQLDQGPFEFSSAQNGVLFDMFGTGRRVRLAWPESPNTAWLALDRNRNGVIDDGTELFGNTRRLDSGGMARNGYEVLADLDANEDSIIDAQDPSFDDLLTWEDRDRNGRSSSDELKGLKDTSIVALHVGFSESRRQDRWGNRFRYRAKVDASSPPGIRFSYDVFLTVDRATGSTVASCGSKMRQE